MDDITNIQEDNIGGLSIIKYAPLRFFQSLSPVIFNTGFDWINLICTTETMSFSEFTTNDANGGYQTVTITGKIPKIRSDVHAALQKYRLQRLIVLCQDNNDNLRLAGTLDGGMILVDSSTTGAAAGDANGYNFQFTGNQLDTAPFM